VQGLMEAAAALPPEVAALIVAAAPVVELRGAIPMAVSMGVNPLEAWCIGVVGSMIPVPFLLAFLGPVAQRLRRSGPLKRLAGVLVERPRRRGEALRRYGMVGLFMLVAVPLPSTGTWTGAAAASLLGLRFWPSLAVIGAGSAVAGLIVVALTLMGIGSVESWPW